MITNRQTEANDPPFEHSGFFVLRTPLLPFAELLRWSEGVEGAADLDDAQLEQALARDRARLRARLDDVIKRRAVREAVFVACPGLEAYVDNWRHEPESKRGRSVERTLVRYLARMAGRATPFGLFAGPSVGRVGDRTRLLVEGQAQYQRHTRVDLNYLFALIESLKTAPALKPHLIYYRNSSLYAAGGRLHYVEARADKKERSYHLVAVDDNQYLAATLDRAGAGASMLELAEALIDDEISRDEAMQYVEQLIDGQILVPDLELSVTGREPLDELIRNLEERAGATPIADRLKQVRNELTAIDAAGLFNEPECYRAAAVRLGGLPALADPEQSFQTGQLFQVDLSKPAPRATLGRAVSDELIGGLEVLHRLSTPRTRTTLARFREAFARRYEDREVPLVEALDDEVGIGFTPPSGPGDEASPLLAGLAFPFRMDRPASWGKGETLLLAKLTEALRQGAREINIAAADLAGLDINPSPLPDAFAVTAVVAARSEAALDAGDFRVLLDSIDGPSGACLLGRFCHTDASLRQLVEQHLRAEEALRPDAVFAEVVHLPEGRVGNILCRPVLRDYEIAYLGGSGASRDKQIPITDLRLKLEGNRLCLRSARLDREVIPRLTSAHNYNWQNVPVYTFLCALQEQNVIVGSTLRWGNFENAPYLPRVVSGRLILSLARWRLNKAEMAALAGQRGAAAFKATQQWRAARGIPRWVALADGDHLLPVDFDNILSLESFLHLLKGRNEATLTEIFPEPDELCVHGPEGRFVHELILPLVRRKKDAAPRREPVRKRQRVGLWRRIAASPRRRVTVPRLPRAASRPDRNGSTQRFTRASRPPISYCATPSARSSPASWRRARRSAGSSYATPTPSIICACAFRGRQNDCAMKSWRRWIRRCCR